MFTHLHVDLVRLLAQFGLFGTVTLLSGNIGFMAALPCAAAEVQDDEANNWMFDKSTYTNNPRTGQRVDQYKREKTPYRDPNAWFDSPTGDFLFDGNSWAGNAYGYGYEPFYYSEMWPEYYDKNYFGDDGSGYYPYDGDPNDEGAKK